MQLGRVLIGALVAFGYFSDLSSAQIKIGVAEALTGNAAQYGVPIRKGFELAAGEINGSGGINGAKIELVIEDEQGKKEEAINVFKKLIFQDKVLMLFGPTLSNSAQASDPVAQAAKVVVFGTSNTADGITSIGNYVFRNSVTEADILPVTLKVAAQKTALKKVAVLYGNDDIFHQERLRQFHKSACRPEDSGHNDGNLCQRRRRFQAAAHQDQSARDPTRSCCRPWSPKAAPIMVQARQLGIPLPFIGGNGMNSPRIFELAKDSSDNLWVGSPWSVENPQRENKRFIERLSENAHGACRTSLRRRPTMRCTSWPRP